MTSKIVVNNIEADAGVSTVTFNSNVVRGDSNLHSTGLALGAGSTVGAVTGVTTYYGDGSQLTGISAGVSLANGVDNRVVTATGAAALNGESTLTYAEPTLEIATTNSSYGMLKLDGNSGGLIEFKDNGTRKWELYGANNFSFYDRANTKYGLVLKPGGDVEVSDGNLVIGTSGHGIDFSAQTPTSATGASTTAEILDHYEEGSWTPVYLNVNTPTYGHQSGTYTRIGRAVHCQFQISVDSGLDTSDGSAVNIGGLPFTGNGAHESVVFSFGRYTSIMSNARLAEVTNFRFGGNYIMLHRGSNYDINYTLLNSSGHLQAAFTYQMA